ncbi:hypothetical protein [Rhodopseudomonas pseudopalustris]|uniref:hypothetical protein n=1 Tax=Rhodopseudomonas pseudopalustris TaxID=1513892 RepID=UPI000B84925A|nr:hypothetical protein [Rhodopseudomonas pseudopalustris]
MYNKIENTQKTVQREVVYAHHPWFAQEVWVHAVIAKCLMARFSAALWTVRRQTAFLRFLLGCSTGLVCASGHGTKDPFVGLDALMALSSLLDLVLKTATPSSNPDFWTDAELLAIRIGEKLMSDKTTCARANQLNRRLGAHQIDLFSRPAGAASMRRHGGISRARRRMRW